MKFSPAALSVRRAFLPLLPLALAACSTMNLPDAPKTIGAPATPNPHYKVGAPYKIDGRWYVPKVDERYDEKGLASWYGDDFQGRLTANGEVFDKRRLSAAHKTLPMPTLVEVENLENGRRVAVRVNDRGPFVDDRIIDLSHAAADALGFAGKGLARVRVRYVGETDIKGLAALPGEAAPAPIRIASKGPARKPTPASADVDPIAALISSSAGQGTNVAAPPDIWVELAAVEDLAALEAMNLNLPDVGPVSVQSGETAGRPWRSLRIGPFIDEAIAVASLSRVRAAGFGGARIVRGPGL
ncbi:MAG: septal ring lytic transglycosylase RlpA family protein [Pseudomonadota bacterium]